MVRLFLLLFSVGVTSVVALAGLRGSKFSSAPLQFVPDMKDQPKLITQHQIRGFKGGFGDSPIVAGSVPYGYSSNGFFQVGASSVSLEGDFARSSDYRNSGIVGGSYGLGIPASLGRELLERGRDRYEIHCSVCHDSSGSGNGVAKRMGLVTVASLLDDRIQSQPEGQIYNTITHGKNTMGAYGPHLSVPDRWAVVAYVRFLQAQGRQR